MDKFNTIEEALEDIKNGKMVVVVMYCKRREMKGYDPIAVSRESRSPEAINL